MRYLALNVSVSSSPEAALIFYMKKLLVFLLLTSCSTAPTEHDCKTINGRPYCRILNEDEQILECIEIQQAIFRGQEATLPAYCDKYKNRYEMTHFIKR